MSASWALQPAQPPWDKLFSSDHRRQLAGTQWFVKATSIFIVFLSRKISLSVKLLIFFPLTERFHGEICFYLHVYATCVGDLGSQKRALGLLELELQIVVTAHYKCWELNLGPLEEQQAPLTTEMSLQPSLLSLFLLRQHVSI